MDKEAHQLSSQENKALRQLSKLALHEYTVRATSLMTRIERELDKINKILNK